MSDRRAARGAAKRTGDGAMPPELATFKAAHERWYGPAVTYLGAPLRDKDHPPEFARYLRKRQAIRLYQDAREAHLRALTVKPTDVSEFAWMAAHGRVRDLAQEEGARLRKVY
jgi:hypothetical protein